MFQKLLQNHTRITFCIDDVFFILTVAETTATEGMLKTDHYNQI